MKQRLLLAFMTRRGLAKFAINSLAAFGGLSGLFQFYSAVFVPKDAVPLAGWITLAVIVVSLSWGTYRAIPSRSASVGLQNPELNIKVEVGNLFERDSHIVVGFCDTFDTDTTRDAVINRRSVQGQLLAEYYGERTEKLDSELDVQLAAIDPVKVELRSDKEIGKLERYPIGTVAQIRPRNNIVFAVAYTTMGNDLRAQATVDGLWHALSSLWRVVASSAQLEPVAIPIVGSELARISSLDRNNLIQLIAMSFVASARERSVSRTLTIVVHPSDEHRINLLELQAFLRGL